MVKLSTLRDVQSRTVGALDAALRGGRLHHAYLLVGADVATAMMVAQAFLASLACEDRVDTDACGNCRACRRLEGANHPDVSRVAPDDRGTIAIESIRDLAARLALRTSEGGTRKLVLMVEADRMTPAAQNALLKTLEEPPGPTCFVLTSVRPRSLLATVRSRCQIVRLHPRRSHGAATRLSASGIDAAHAGVLAALVGDDADAARELLEQGAAELLEQLSVALRAGQSPRALLDLAAEVGADRAKADLLLQLLEVLVRDMLAGAHGVDRIGLYGGDTWLSTPLRRSHVWAAAGRLQQLRRWRAVNVNRTMAIESALFMLHGHGDVRVGA